MHMRQPNVNMTSARTKTLPTGERTITRELTTMKDLTVMKKPRKKISATSGQIGKSARAIFQIAVQELLAGFYVCLAQASCVEQSGVRAGTYIY